MGYLSCNADSAVSTCDSYNFTKKPFKIKHYSYSDLYNSTNGFSNSNFLGRGSHRSVYKASLEGGKLIAAVKTTSCTNSPTDNEIEILSHVRSPRLVNLLGLAHDSNQKALIVIEFMPNGTLYDALHPPPPPTTLQIIPSAAPANKKSTQTTTSNTILSTVTNKSNIFTPVTKSETTHVITHDAAAKLPSWSTRFRFALHIAKALNHLHSSNPPIIHRDIKSSNILLDAKRKARLGDFGLALRGHVDEVRVMCIPPAGTLGYLDPCYVSPADISTKTDVYSFGTLLLEIISGRNAIDLRYSPSSVAEWAAPLIRGGAWEMVCDPMIGPPRNAAAVRRMTAVAEKCVRYKAEKRPGMAEVVEWLRGVGKKEWRIVGQRVGMNAAVRGVKYKVVEEDGELVKKGGSRRNRKVSSVGSPWLLEVGSDLERIGRSRSIGSTNVISFGPLDSNLTRKKVGLGVKMPNVRLRKSRSTGVLLGRKLVENNGLMLGIVKSPSNNNNNNNGRGLEESKLLIDNLGKGLMGVHI